MKFLRLCLLIFISIAFLTSCKKPVAKQTAFIPKNAVFVATFNTKSLEGKLAKNENILENIVKNISGSDTSVNKGKQEFEDLQTSGIDLDENFYVAVVNNADGANEKGTTTTSAIAALKDESKLEAYLKKKDPSVEVKKEKDFSYTTVHENNVVAWGKDVVMVMRYQKSFSANDMEYDSATGSFNLHNPGNGRNEMLAEIQKDFSLPQEQSVASIPEFRDVMQEKADAIFWMNSTATVQNLPLPLPKMKELFSNSYTAAKVDFEDGKININSKSYYNKDLTDILKKDNGTSADASLVENYPSDNIDGFAVFSFNPDVINEVVKYLEVGGMVDAYLTKMMGTDYTLQDALKAIKGDFAITVSDFATTPSTDTTKRINRGTPPHVNMIVKIPVGDKVQMNRVLNKLVEMHILEKTNNQYNLPSNLQQAGYTLSVDDKNIFLTSNQSFLDQYKSKTKKANLDKNVMNDFKGKSGIMYVNFQTILNGISMPANDSASAVVAKAKATFKDMEGYINNFDGKSLEGHGEIRFLNEKENSLTSLLSFVETASKNIKRRKVVVEDTDVQAAPGNMPESKKTK